MGPVPRVAMQSTVYIQANFCATVIAQPALPSAHGQEPTASHLQVMSLDVHERVTSNVYKFLYVPM